MSDLTSVSKRVATTPVLLYVLEPGMTYGTAGLQPTLFVGDALDGSRYYDFSGPRMVDNAEPTPTTRTVIMTDLGRGYYRYDLPIAAAVGLTPGTLLQAQFTVGSFTTEETLFITPGESAVLPGSVAVDDQGVATGSDLAKALFDEKQKRAMDAKILPDPANPPPAYATAIKEKILDPVVATDMLTKARLDELRLYAIDANAAAAALARFVAAGVPAAAPPTP